jgi:Ca-activated chloride channel homolog
MSRPFRPFRSVLFLLLAALTLGTVPAQAADLVLVSPSPGRAVFGEIEVLAQVSPSGAGVTRVEFYLDGRRIGVIDNPPYRIVVDVGQDNVEHRFEAVAYSGPNSPAVASTTLRTPKIQTDEEISVRLRQLYITVEGGKGSLERDDFTVVERGDRQKIVTFERGDIPFTAVLLVDASGSMHGERLQTALDGARSFVETMRPLDEAKVQLFADRLLLETPFTSVPAVLNLALAGARAAGGTALNDALYLSAKRLEVRQGRRVLILLSDGGDIESVVSMAQVRKILQRDPMAVYWLRLRREEERRGSVARLSIWRNAKGHQQEIDDLEAAVEESGGRIHFVDSIDQVSGALNKILNELREQYVLGYYSSGDESGAWRNVKVDVRGGGRIRVQKGRTGP